MTRLDPPIWITEQDIETALARPSYFGCAGGPRELFRTWSLGPAIERRDSTLLDKSNAAALVAHLERDRTLDSEWQIVTVPFGSHGWVQHLAFRALDERGAPTRIIRVIKDWFVGLEDVPIADPEDLSRREYEATIENIREAGWCYVTGDVPDDWPAICYEWFAERAPSAVQPHEGDGGYPSPDEMHACLRELRFLDPEFDDEAEE